MFFKKNNKKLLKVTSLIFLATFLQIINPPMAVGEPLACIQKPLSSVNDNKTQISKEKNEENIDTGKDVNLSDSKQNSDENHKKENSNDKNKTNAKKNKVDKKVTKSNKNNEEIETKKEVENELKEIIDKNGKKRKYSKKITGTATAYTAKSTAKTSTGALVGSDVVAVHPGIIPYGTEVLIKTSNKSLNKPSNKNKKENTDKTSYESSDESLSENSGEIFQRIAKDTGGALRKRACIVDVFMNNVNDCKKFGRKKVDVYLLEAIKE